jgi:hypothetical protein
MEEYHRLLIFTLCVIFQQCDNCVSWDIPVCKKAESFLILINMFWCVGGGGGEWRNIKKVQDLH